LSKAINKAKHLKIVRRSFKALELHNFPVAPVQRCVFLIYFPENHEGRFRNRKQPHSFWLSRMCTQKLPLWKWLWLHMI